MAEQRITPEDNELVAAQQLNWRSLPPFIDVRSPGEFATGHIPGARNVPLFTDAERAEIGTLYKQVGRQEALDRGLEIVGPKLAHLVKEIREHGGTSPLIYCWRGGMRSASVCSLMMLSGMPCLRLSGGYKAFRSYVRTCFSAPLPLILLGGYTGSGKTELLHHLAAAKVQILDLEGLANHKGSAFGHINENPQPTNEQFSNELFVNLQQLNLDKPILVENESRLIGKIHLPEEFFQQMRAAPIIEIAVAKEQRIARLVKDYARTSQQELLTATRRIAKKLGPERLEIIENFIKTEQFSEAGELLLTYYDTYYQRGAFKRPEDLIHHVKLSGSDLRADLNLITKKIEALAGSGLKKRE